MTAHPAAAVPLACCAFYSIWRLQNSEFQIADGFHLVSLEEAEYEAVMPFINHSCEPSVGFAGNIVLVAMRDISPGRGANQRLRPLRGLQR